jgi:hypothetical protein
MLRFVLGADQLPDLSFAAPDAPAWIHDDATGVDWDGNGVVNSADVGQFINTWFEDQANGTLNADFDGNGISNSTDVGEFINAWFVGCDA